MGQCYTVEANFKFKDNDPASFCQIIQREIAARNNVSAVFDLDRGNLNDPFDCFKILTSKDACKYTNDIWCADFDASYGWHGVMHDVFKSAFRVLDEGSWLTIYPDNGHETISVKFGETIVSYGEDGGWADGE